MDALPLRRLLIVSHVRHYRHGDQLYAYGPYAREIEIWADLFPEVVIAAPLCHAAPPGDCVPLARPNIQISPLKDTGGDTLGAKLHQLLHLPGLVASLARGMRRADAVHVRCPGNVGLLGVVMAPLFRRPRIAKYAGQWNGHAAEKWTVALQRRLLRSWWNAPVTVYGAWPNQPPHVTPFFTSMMTDEQVRHAVQVAESKQLGSPLRVLFAGRLAPEKRVGALLEGVRQAVDGGVELEVALVGDGPERESLMRDIERLDLITRVQVVGALSFDDTMGWYEWAHCLVLPSVHSEGWPKVVAEAMCHGVVCVAVDHGQVSSMLRGRGVLLQDGTSGEIARALDVIARNPALFTQQTMDASRWARQHSLEGLRTALRHLMAERWALNTATAEARR